MVVILAGTNTVKIIIPWTDTVSLGIQVGGNPLVDSRLVSGDSAWAVPRPIGFNISIEIRIQEDSCKLNGWAHKVYSVSQFTLDSKVSFQTLSLLSFFNRRFKLLEAVKQRSYRSYQSSMSLWVPRGNFPDGTEEIPVIERFLSREHQLIEELTIIGKLCRKPRKSTVRRRKKRNVL
jgi:hypothetical protein